MNKQSLIIYNLPVLFNILNEIKENFSFNLFNIDTEKDLININEEDFGNYIILTSKKNEIEKYNNKLVLEKFPFKITNIIESINIALLKQKYNEQSEVKIGQYRLDINSREIFNKNKRMKLTEREIEMILFLKKSNNTQSVENLQKEVWGHSQNLETHTVETHIYRLRKKINESFNDEKFILSTKNGYKI